MASGVAAGLTDKLKTATTNVVAARTTTPLPPASPSNPFNGTKLADYKNSQTSGNLTGAGGTWSAKLVPNATPSPASSTPAPVAPVTGNVPPPPGTNNIQYNPNNVFTPGSNGGYDPAAEEKAYLQMQLDALSGQQQSAQLATQFGVDTNNAYLTEQLANLQKQNNVDNDAAQQLQNRRGGFYSGGLDTQLSSIGQGYADAQGGVTRDVASRNQQLLDQYGTQANAIAQQIQELQSASPDIIRERLQSWINNERNYGLDYANTFGNLNGQNTMAQNNQDFNQQFATDQFGWQQQMDTAGLTGQFNGQQTMAGQNQSFNQQLATQQQSLDNKNANLNAALGYSDLTGQVLSPQNDWSGLPRQAANGAPLSMAGQQQQTSNQQWQASFDQAKYESDRNYQQQVQQQSIANGQWQQQFNNDVQNMGFQQASELWSQAFQQNQAGQDDAYRKEQLQQDMTQQDRTAATQATTAIMNSGLVTTTNDAKTGKQSMNVSNPESLSKYIVALNLSDNATDALLYQYGLDSYVKK